MHRIKFLMMLLLSASIFNNSDSKKMYNRRGRRKKILQQNQQSIYPKIFHGVKNIEASTKEGIDLRHEKREDQLDKQLLKILTDTDINAKTKKQKSFKFPPRLKDKSKQPTRMKQSKQNKHHEMKQKSLKCPPGLKCKSKQSTTMKQSKQNKSHEMKHKSFQCPKELKCKSKQSTRMKQSKQIKHHRIGSNGTIPYFEDDIDEITPGSNGKIPNLGDEGADDNSFSKHLFKILTGGANSTTTSPKIEKSQSKNDQHLTPKASSDSGSITNETLANDDTNNSFSKELFKLLIESPTNQTIKTQSFRHKKKPKPVSSKPINFPNGKLKNSKTSTTHNLYQFGNHKPSSSIPNIKGPSIQSTSRAGNTNTVYNHQNPSISNSQTINTPKPYQKLAPDSSNLQIASTQAPKQVSNPTTSYSQTTSIHKSYQQTNPISPNIQTAPYKSYQSSFNPTTSSSQTSNLQNPYQQTNPASPNSQTTKAQTSYQQMIPTVQNHQITNTQSSYQHQSNPTMKINTPSTYQQTPPTASNLQTATQNLYQQYVSTASSTQTSNSLPNQTVSYPHKGNIQQEAHYTTTQLIKILAFGDSLTQGMHTNGQLVAPYTDRLEQLLNTNTKSQHFQVINDGIGGQCVYPEMLTRLPISLFRHQENLKLVVILGGTNDLRMLDCEKTINLGEEIIKLHKLAHDMGYRTVIVTIPEADERSSILPYPFETYRKLWQATNEKLRQYANTESKMTFLCDLAKLFPMFSLHPNHKELYWSDQLHPTKLGYEKMAELLHETISKIKL